MASLIQAFVDKENQLAVPGRGKTGPALHPASFQAVKGKVAQATPRRVLGDVNRKEVTGQNHGGRKALGQIEKNTAPKKSLTGPNKKSLQQLRPPQPASKPDKAKSQEKQKQSTRKAEQKPQSVSVIPQGNTQRVVPWEDDEIEHMPVYEEPEDDYDDIWPKAERPATYLNELIYLRPTHIYPCEGVGHGSEDELELPIKEPLTIKDDTLEEPDLELDCTSLQEVAHCWNEIPLPSLDSLCLAD